jgi:hypothetical protein
VAVSASVVGDVALHGLDLLLSALFGVSVMCALTSGEIVSSLRWLMVMGPLVCAPALLLQFAGLILDS